MKEWILQNFDASVIVAALGFLASSCTGIIGLINAVSSKKSLKKLVDQARENKYWSNCPHCGKRIYLDELSWHMPSGDVDNDFNGVPDVKEKDA